ncbi:MAG: hypothetical protein AAGI27_11500 [Pseudomonadota bacterium]
MRTTLPDDALLSRYAVAEDGVALPHYTDCFRTRLPLAANLETYVKAFYTTPLFRSERLVLRVFGIRSSDTEIDAVLSGQQRNFAAWTVEDKTDEQLLMCDLKARTRSWFWVVPDEEHTQLYFGSAVIAKNGELRPAYRALIGLHQFYSHHLLSAARKRLIKHHRD